MSATCFYRRALVSLPHATIEAFDLQASLSNDYSAQTDQAAELIQSDICGGVIEPFSDTVTILCLIGKVNFMFGNRLVS